MNRRVVLGGLAVGLALLAGLILREVIGTVVFAVTVAYVLYGPRQRLVDRGLSIRGSTLLVTLAAGGGLVLAVAPIAYVLYRRRGDLLGLIRGLPSEIPVTLGEFSLVVETAPIVDAAVAFVRDASGGALATAGVLSLKLMLFAIVVYGLLLRPETARAAVAALVPSSYHGVVFALHERARETLLGIYVLQAVTALGTTVVAFVVFVALGYPTAATLAVIAGILQFVPVLGPSVLIVALAAADVLAGDPTRAVLVLVVGLTFVGFVPDAVLRPRLAKYAADLPMVLYFVGFVGGVLTVGVLGFVLGPLAVALLVESAELLAEELEQEPDELGIH